MYHVRVLHGEPVVFRLFLGKKVAALGFFCEWVPFGYFGYNCTGWGPAVFSSQPVHVGHFG